MPSAPSKPCLVEGCSSPTNGKPYCAKHAVEVRQGKRPKSVKPLPSGAMMRSLCCDAPCKAGDRHEYGEQYCKACGEPCAWKTA